MSASESSSRSPRSSASPSPPGHLPSDLPFLPDSRYGASGIQLPRRASQSRRDHPEGHTATSSRRFEQSFSEFLRDNPIPQQPAEMSPEERRQSIMAMDRKRRLTGSTADGERRRGADSGFPGPAYRHSDLERSSQSPASRPGGSNVEGPIQHEVVDLTESSPPPSPPRNRHPSRTSSSSSRRYIVPPWQADSDVSECPICQRPFTWMFRRHHCRKCGRVVCNDCSPHRITIPRQFIVNPPGPDLGSTPNTTATPRHVETVDLTGEDEEGEARTSSRNRRSAIISALEGGEKVRLCNPCVPDPQPEPLPNFPLFMNNHVADTQFASRQTFSGFPPPRPNSFHTNILGQPSRSSSIFPPTFDQDLRLSGAHNYSSVHNGRSRHSSLLDPYSARVPPPPPPPPRFGLSSSPGSRSFVRPRPLNNELPPIPPGVQGESSMYGHGRYQSLDSSSRMRFDSSGRPGVRSLVDVDPHYPNMVASGSVLRSQGQEPSRPRLRESDICPICRRGLPPRGPNGDETAREAHIMACISSRDVTGGSGGGQSSSSSGMLHMVSFTANEKDCIGEDGNAQECSICMEEYDVGDQLSRLECFCKFHKQCIVSWLSRKAECPVHKAGEMSML